MSNDTIKIMTLGFIAGLLLGLTFNVIDINRKLSVLVERQSASIAVKEGK